MSLAETIYTKIQKLSHTEQAEILDFIDFIKFKHEHDEKQDFSEMSLSMAMKGMEEEDTPYEISDIKDRY